MHKRSSILFAIHTELLFLALVLIGGCAPPSIPVPLPTTGNLYNDERIIQELIDESAYRYDVIEKLGYPNRQNDSQASYKACLKHGGIAWIGPDNTGRKRDCYEIVLEFDSNNKLIRYHKHPFAGKFTTSGRLDIDDMRLLAEKGIPEAQWDLYNDYGRKAEDLIWLCRSADNGYAKAQLRVGDIYLERFDIEQNKIKSYVWFKLAKTGNGILVLSHEQLRAVSRLGRIELTSAEQKEAERLYEEWRPGQCNNELLPAIIE